MRGLWALYWTEYERGWGSRPDGISLYSTKEAALARVAADNAERLAAKFVPDEYSIPSEPRFVEIKDISLYDEVMQNGSKWVQRLP